MNVSLFRRTAPVLALAGALSLLAGCASAPRSTASVAAFQDTVEFNGRIAISFIRDGKKEAMNGNFNWQQTPSRTDVSLNSPTGQTVARISVTDHAATLQQSGQPLRTAPDLDSLTRQTLGWTLPVGGLRDWLQGHATDADGKPFTASPANDAVVTRDGWKIEYLGWQDEAAAVPQPRRIDVTRLTLGQQVDELSFRIVLDPAAPAS
ncbi:outer membrane lipoprotein LolB [Duganella sp. Leaf126]|nr:outer membrane lipoprotein LolB [Duganella sp. Leaf126]